MVLKINISRKHLIVLLAIVIVGTVINYNIAFTPGQQGHPASEIELSSGNTLDDNPADGLIDTVDIKQGSGSGLDADTVDGIDSTALGGASAFVMQSNTGPGAQANCELKCGAGNCAFSYTDDGGGYMKWIDDCSNTLYGQQPNRCACLS